MSRWFLVLAVVLLQCVALLPVNAAPNAYESGVRAFKDGKHELATKFFQAAAQTQPTNPSIRYYLGMCYQSMSKNDRARKEYEYVAKTGTGSLPALATAALQKLGPAPASTSASSVSSNGMPKIKGQLHVLDFYTVWCKPCKRFEPIFESVASRMRGRADFRRVDAEDPKNKSLVQKYGVSMFPTLLYIDDAGTEIYRGGPTPRSDEEFENTIRIVLGK